MARKKTVLRARGFALRALLEVLHEGHSLSRTLAQRTTTLTDPREQALAGELCHGVLRWLPQLEAIIGQCVHRPIKARDRDLRIVLLLGIYQLLHTRIPPHAVVAETVALAETLGKGWAKGFVNGILRGLQRDQESIVAGIKSKPVAALAHPAWLIDATKKAWPEHWQAVLQANLARAPMTLRVNLQRQSREYYLEQLAAAGHSGHAAEYAETAIHLDEACAVQALPSFAEGDVSVQDAAAQLAAPLLDPQAGQRVLDACAAPGGKTAHLLEYAPAIKTLTALECDPERIPRLQENLQRLQLAADIRCADATQTADWWDGEPYDRILIDAPCSGTGVIRRHPDIKVLRRAGDIPRLAHKQHQLLEALWPLLAHDGVLLYATCSILPAENQQLAHDFATLHSDAKVQIIDASWGHAKAPGRQILPAEDGMDGFFYARFQKH